MAEGDCINIEVQDFKFKSECKIKLFQGEWTKCDTPLNLVATSNKLDIVIAGTPNGLAVLQIQQLLSAGENCPRRLIPLENITHVAVNCDDTLLAVIVSRGECPFALIYNCSHLLTEHTVVPIGQAVLGSQPGIGVSQLAWNPVNPVMFCVCLTNGAIATFNIKAPGSVELINSLPNANSTCCSWSPKGKQVVVGSVDGTLTQYMPDLKCVKTLPLPSPLTQPAKVLSCAWLSSFQFAVAYLLGPSHSDDIKLNICIVNAPKQGPVTCKEFEDVCYSMGSLRAYQFYLLHQLTWNVLIVASANGTEVGVMGAKTTPTSPGQTLDWQQWTLEDSARAEMPISGSDEDFPIGMAINYSSVQPLPYEEYQLAPMPLLLLLSHRGTLLAFDMMNLKQGATALCCAPQLPANVQTALFNTPAVTPTKPVPTAAVTPQTTTPVPKPAEPHPSMFKSPASFQPAIAQPASFQPTVSQPASFQPTVSQPASFQPTVSQPASFQPTVSQPTSFQPAIPQLTGFQSVPSTVSQPVSFQSGSTVTRASSAPVSTATPPAATVHKPTVETAKTTPEPQELSDEAFNQAAANVLRQFQDEVANSIKHSQEINVKVGSAEEGSTIRQDGHDLSDTVKTLKREVRDTSEQVYTLQNLVTENFRLDEDAESRVQQRNHPGFAELVHTRPLDPSSESQLRDIQRNLLYIESQLAQASSAVQTCLASRGNGKTHRRYQLPSFTTMTRTSGHHKKILTNLETRCACMNAKASSHGLCTTAQRSSMDMKSLEEALTTLDTDNDKKPSTPQPILPMLSKMEELELSNLLKDSSILITVEEPVPVVSHLAFQSPNKYQPATEPISPVPAYSTALPVKSGSSNKPTQPAATIGFTTPGSFVTMPPSTSSGPLFQKPTFTKVAAPPAHGTPIVVSLFGAKTMDKPTSTPTSGFSFTPPASKALNFSSTPSTSPPKPASDKPLPFSTLSSEKPSIFSQSVFGGKPTEITTLFGQTSETLKSTVEKSEKIPLFGGSVEIPGSVSIFSTPIEKPISFGGNQPDSSSPSGNKPETSFFGTSASKPFLFAIPSIEKAVEAKQPNKPFQFDQEAAIFSPKESSPPTIFTEETPKPFGSNKLLPQFGQLAKEPPTFGQASKENTPLMFAPTFRDKREELTPETPKSQVSTPVSPLLSSILSRPIVDTTDKSEVVSPEKPTDTTVKTTTAATTPVKPTQVVDLSTKTSSSLGGSLSGSGTTPTVFGTPSTVASTVFGTPSTVASTVFGTPSTVASTVFETPSTSASTVFGTPSTVASTVLGTPSTSASSVFGTPSTASSTVLGTPSTLASTVFSTPTKANSTMFGTASTPSSTAFGIPSASTAPIFETPATSKSAGFGTPTTSTTTLFGIPSTSASTVFGQATPATNPVFGQSGSVFGTPKTTSEAINFGQTSSTPVFGGSNTTTTSVFGNSATTTPVFGGSTFGNSASVFGGTPTTTSATVFGNTFGQPAVTTTASSSFGSPNIFGQSPATTEASATQVTSLFGSMGSSGGSMFGGSSSFAPKPAASIFGGGATPDNSGNLFGNTQACSPSDASKNLFGNTGASPNPFASTAAANKPAASPASIFGQSPGGTSFSSAGGSMFGQSPGPFSSGVPAGSSPFHRTPGASVFGNTATPSSPAQVFGGPPTFGSASTSPGGFGAPPAFGGAPAFGSPPAFGGGATFGAAANRNVFGQPGAAPSFGASSEQNAGFSALASQNTIGFGNLAQQSPAPQPSAAGFGTFGTAQQPQQNNNQQGSSFGGSSFSSWR